MFLRSCAMAIAALALTGCATGYGGSYGTHPAYSYYDDDYYYDRPYYGGFGHGPYFHDFDDDDDRYFRPAKNVTCDRARDICYDSRGLSYQATQDYLGEREANRAAKKYGDRVFLFSPKDGVTCDRRSQSCSKDRWTERIFDDDSPNRPRVVETRDRKHKWHDDDDIATKRLLPDRPRRSVDNGKPKPDRSGDGACPPRGCSNK